MALKLIRRLVEKGCDEVVLETEETNIPALKLYEHLGFVRDKRIPCYYLNGVAAYRLKLWVKPWQEVRHNTDLPPPDTADGAHDGSAASATEEIGASAAANAGGSVDLG